MFQRFRESKLKIGPFECEFLTAEVQFLGHVVTDEGLRTDPKKTEAVRSFPEPWIVKQSARFSWSVLALSSFVQNYSKVAKPLYDLLKKDAI